METRRIGSLEVSVVGLGCNNFGGRIDEARTREVIDAALEAGITLEPLGADSSRGRYGVASRCPEAPGSPDGRPTGVTRPSRT